MRRLGRMVSALRVFETVLYAPDLDAAERFYRDVVGLELIAHGEVLVAFRCGVAHDSPMRLRG